MEKETDKTGLLYGILAYTAWGILPLYWKLLDEIPATQILAHRIFWSFVFVIVLLLASHNWKKVIVICKNKKNVLLIFLCACFVTINWGTYIWAVNSGHVVESSMGYYINPLVVFLFSVTILREKLNHWQIAAIFLAAIGVLIITLQYGKIPWVALILAVSFAIYGLIKKLINVDAMGGLALETAVIAPFALIYILFRESQGLGALGSAPPVTLLLLIGSGIITATPLLWFAQATRRLHFSTVGFLQYICPSLSLILGVFVFKEPFTTIHLLSFGFIWMALIIYTLANVGVLKSKSYSDKLVKDTN